ncbi:Mandelate racemase/muconate lactonizing enzyme, C-terminal domain protein [Candidatus Sulfopaludibacter sp. SbA3]|nr:Mandelate racemase/muconate lactonizing enzyme, C-terminal domain protein [Candidatus Sulfopaludibacter sp. SbA3]
MPTLSRRHFLAALPVAAALAETKPAKITAVETWEVRGHRDTMRGVDQQYQVNPLYIYDELRPAPYRDSASPTSSHAPVSALYLKIKTDAGVEGFYGPIDKEVAIVVDEQLRPFLMGKDALAQEKLWDQLYRSNRHARRGFYLMAISAVDNTLWDLRGRYFKTPVYRLLGGPTRATVEAYASCLGYSLEPDKAPVRAAQVKSEGFRYQKWFLAYGPGDGPEGLHKNVELVRLLREAVGEDTELMFDVYSGWDLSYALSWAKQVERYRPRWIEEATQAEKIDSFAQLRKGTSIPVASGEHIQGRWEVYDYLKEGALSVVQCDPEWCGGTTELQKICAVASLFDVPVIPHGHSLHAALHLIASQSPAVCPLAEYLILKMKSYYHFEKNPPVLTRAHFALPETPGYGIELDEAKVESREQIHWS